MTLSIRDRRRAKAFQQALERYERALEEGKDRDAAFREVSATAGPDARLLLFATGMRDALAPAPEPRTVEMFAARLRASEIRRKPRLIRRPKLGLAPLALAACTVIISGVLIPSLGSLPGDRLYGVKSTAEDARVWFATGSAEARIRLGLAHERFSEVEELIERANLEALAYGAADLDGVAGSVDGIDDPKLAQLIDQTLAEAGHHIETAAKILIAEPGSSTDDLDELVAISHRGRELADEVVEDLPNTSQSPVLDTAVKFAKIEAKAKAARMGAEPEPTPPPCATPTPTPEPSASPDGALESATPTVVESPSPTPTATPEPTPCVSPPPTPTPSPTPDATTSPDPDADAQPTAEPDGGSANDGSALEVSPPQQDGHASGSDGDSDA